MTELTEIEKMYVGALIREIRPQQRRKRHMKTADNTKPGRTIAPTYRGIVPLLIAALRDGTDKGRKLATAELYQMADLADAYNAIIGDHNKSEI
ncbi:hypothetical protein EOA32_00725 [Mesorhizobium sp. M1A.F.Ca.ET.072.01.1.1]|uniref:hypothetical protein n=1 Tax=Mesorhizobium sp. M1A.F.Ca.ET.072.01.1.1 TaxID=2496753 RepID=UPI000FD5E98D|nr:hypothetical protein [Mesorhizobium sp. M1A.F.Ca.ET.072.01.1.1]RUW55575.1 hypothetical protein EOA32_00725 [Mesorhizobium sp. M1A.F.Ca.ET.072.01.1.1]